MPSEHDTLHRDETTPGEALSGRPEERRAPHDAEIRSLVERLREDGSPRALHVPWLLDALAVVRQLGDALAILGGQWAGLLLLRSWFPDVALPERSSSITVLTGTGVMLLLMGYVGLNAEDFSILNIRETQKILRSWLITSIATPFLLYLARVDTPLSAWIAVWTMSLPLLLAHRDLFWHISRWLHKRSIVQTTALIYGTGTTGRMLLKKLRLMPEMGVRIAGFIDDDPRKLGERVEDVPVLGDFTDLAALLRLTGSRRIYIALAQVPRRTITDILAVCRARHVDFQIVPTLHDMALPRIRLEEIDGIPLLGVSHATLHPFRGATKRFVDLVVGSLLLVVCSPFLLAGIVVTRALVGRPVLQKFRRVGRDGRVFDMFRLRIGPRSEAPPSRAGRLLNRLAIDAMPKLLNVLRGDMSLVGPRAALVRDFSRYDEFHHLRLNVRPGLTGLWHILPHAPAEGDDSLDIDLQYIHNQSLLLDLSILLETARNVLLPRKTPV